jgi:transcriptional regulator GlxA family with amidase domain
MKHGAMFYERLPEPLVFTFLLVEELSLMGLASAIDTLRSANRLLGRNAFEWRLTSLDGLGVRASNGIELAVVQPAEALQGAHALFTCSSIRIDASVEKRHIAILRQAANRGLAIGSLSTGSQILAKAGLLDGYRCTIHWENIAALEDDFPNVEVTRKLYEIDRNRLTCSGGSAAMDMMLHIVADRYGPALARSIANQFHHDRIRDMEQEQRSGDMHRLVTLPPSLQGAISLMGQNIEEPISIMQVAEANGMSTRQMERLFSRYLCDSPSHYYLSLRIERARELLLYTNRSVLNVAVSVGFASPSHFSAWFRRFHQLRPSEFRDKSRRREKV